MADEQVKKRPWWKWKSSIGAALTGIAIAIVSLPDFPVFAIHGTVFTSHAIGGCIGGIAVAIGGVGLASKLEAARKPVMR